MNRRPPVYGVLDAAMPLELPPNPTPREVIREATRRIHQAGGQISPRDPEVLLRANGFDLCYAVAGWIESDSRARGWHRISRAGHDARVFAALAEALPVHRRPKS